MVSAQENVCLILMLKGTLIIRFTDAPGKSYKIKKLPCRQLQIH